MLPVMNIMFLLIPALLLSMEVASLAAISVSPPQFTVSPKSDRDEPPEPTAALRIRIAADGFSIERAGASDQPGVTDPSAGRGSGPSIPLAKPGAALDDPTRFDYAALHARVAQLRGSIGEIDRLEISAEPQIAMQVLVSTIDAVQDPEHPLPLLIADSF